MWFDLMNELNLTYGTNTEFKKTIFDTIRAMTDEELAKFLSSLCLGCNIKSLNPPKYSCHACKVGIIERLKRLVRGESNDNR